MSDLLLMVEDWMFMKAQIIAVSAAVLAVLVGMMVVRRVQLKRHTLSWYCAYCVMVAGIMGAALMWTGHWAVTKAILWWVIVAIAEAALAFYYRPQVRLILDEGECT